MAGAEPMAPRILNDLYMKNPTGQRLGFLATFSNMRSTQLALGDKNKVEAVNKIRRALAPAYGIYTIRSKENQNYSFQKMFD